MGTQKITCSHKNYTEKPLGILGVNFLCKLEWTLSNGQTISEERTCLDATKAYEELSKLLELKLKKLNEDAESDTTTAAFGEFEELKKKIDDIEKRLRDLESGQPYTWPFTPKPNTPWEPYSPWTPVDPITPRGPVITYYTTNTTAMY